MTTSSGKLLEDFIHANVVLLLYKPITSARRTDDLSSGFDRDLDRKRRNLPKKQNVKLKIMLHLNSKTFLVVHSIKKKLRMV